MMHGCDGRGGALPSTKRELHVHKNGVWVLWWVRAKYKVRDTRIQEWFMGVVGEEKGGQGQGERYTYTRMECGFGGRGEGWPRTR